MGKLFANGNPNGRLDVCPMKLIKFCAKYIFQAWLTNSIAFDSVELCPSREFCCKNLFILCQTTLGQSSSSSYDKAQLRIDQVLHQKKNNNPRIQFNPKLYWLAPKFN